MVDPKEVTFAGVVEVAVYIDVLALPWPVIDIVNTAYNDRELYLLLELSERSTQCRS